MLKEHLVGKNQPWLFVCFLEKYSPTGKKKPDNFKILIKNTEPEGGYIYAPSSLRGANQKQENDDIHGPHSHLPNEKLHEWGPAMCILESRPHGSEACLVRNHCLTCIFVQKGLIPAEGTVCWWNGNPCWLPMTSGSLRPPFSETHYNGLISFTLMAWDTKERGHLLVGFLKIF